MRGTLAQVSTLFSTVGRFHSPRSTVCTYLARGRPTRPSREAIRAVDSPQTKAPAPCTTRMRKSWPEPRMSSPSSPSSSACRRACVRWRTASGYSARTYTYPSREPRARAPMIIPSMTECGLPSSTERSM